MKKIIKEITPIKKKVENAPTKNESQHTQEYQLNKMNSFILYRFKEIIMKIILNLILMNGNQYKLNLNLIIKLKVIVITYCSVESYVLIVDLYMDLRYVIQMISMGISYSNVIINLTELNAQLLLLMKKQLKILI